MADEGLVGQRVPAVRQPLEVLLADLSSQSPLLGELAVPLTGDPIAGRVVVVAGAAELFRVTGARLRGAQRLRDGEHGVPSTGRTDQTTSRGMREAIREDGSPCRGSAEHARPVPPAPCRGAP